MSQDQKTLSKSQIEAFYHNDFVDDQVHDFIKLYCENFSGNLRRVIDIGGGVWLFRQGTSKGYGI